MNKDSLHGRKIITNISAGLIAGLMFVVLSISLSTLIFSGALEPYLSRGIGLFLFSAVALAVVVALLGKFRGFTVTPQDGPAALLAVAAGGITSVLIAKGNPEAVVPTVAAGIIVCSTRWTGCTRSRRRSRIHASTWCATTARTRAVRAGSTGRRSRRPPERSRGASRVRTKTTWTPGCGCAGVRGRGCWRASTRWTRSSVRAAARS